MKIASLTLIPNRSPGPPVRTRMVIYRRETLDGRDVVFPYRVSDDPARDPALRIDRVEWSTVAPCDTDPEFERAWREHVASQAPTVG
jgi:hypothetical protein